MENNVINFHERRMQLEQEEVLRSYHDMFQTLIELYLQYFVYPVIAAVATAHQKRIVKVRH